MEYEAFKKVAATVLGMDPNEIEPDMTLTTDLGADSLDLYQIIMGIEDELNITIPSEGLENITTVREAVELIEKANS